MKARLFVSFLVMLTALAVIPRLMHAQTVDAALRPAAANQSSQVKTVPVEQLSAIVEKLIKEVEDSTLPCQTRNSEVGKLRLLDDALLSGHLLTAQTFALAWRQDAWSMMGAGLISPEVGSSIQNRLSHIQGTITSSSLLKPKPTRKWKPLPSCELSTSSIESSSALPTLISGNLVAGSYTPAGSDPSVFAKVLIKTMLGKVPLVGFIISGLVDVLWPQGTGTDEYGNELPNLFQSLVDQSTYSLVSSDLKGLGDLLMDKQTGWNTQVGNWRDTCRSQDNGHNNGGFDSYDCVNTARQTLWPSFLSKLDNFTTARPRFQQNSGTDYRVKLLPLFAQYENLYLSFLRDGMLLRQYWRDRTDLNKDWIDLDGDMAANAMVAELDLSDRTKGVAYVDTIYKVGLDQQPDALTKDGWNTRNAYIRSQTLNVLDYRDMWKYQNPRAYPDGVPGGVKLTRIIYSDLVGAAGTELMPSLPHNVAGPLKEISAWTKSHYQLGTWTMLIGSLQATSPLLLGPAQSGAITPDIALTPNHAHYYNLNALGPIIGVAAALDLPDDCRSSYISFNWAAGGWSTQGFICHDYLKHIFNYDGEVLAEARVIGYRDLQHQTGDVAHAFVFGFRYADSFNPAGEAIGVASGNCIDLPSWTNGTQAVIHSCYQPPTPAQIWTYDPVLQQISVTNPAEYNDEHPTDSGKHCLDTAGGGTAPYTAVVINACDGGAVTYDSSGKPIVSSQRWTIEAVGAGIGKITNVKSGLVIDVYNNGIANGTPLQLYYYHDSAAGQWQAHWPLTGEIHGIGSGRCVDVPNYSTTPGTQVQIYDCHGNAAQQWTYDPTNKELIYAMHPSLCLEARGGATTAGTAVQINTCTGAPEQQWTLQGISQSSQGGGTITNVKSGLVMDVTGGNTGNNTLVQLYTANGTEAQQWSRTSSQGRTLYSVAAGKCLDVPSLNNGIQAVIRTCASPLIASQAWTYHPIAQTYTVDSPSGPKCLDVSGTMVVIDNCTPAASQRWSRDRENHTVTNVASGLVLDLTEGRTTDGTTVQLSVLPLDGQGTPIPTSSQKWAWSVP